MTGIRKSVGRLGRAVPPRIGTSRGGPFVRVGPVPPWWFRHPEPDTTSSSAPHEREAVMATEQDPYLVLGLSPAASPAEITSAYRRLLREHHPDTRVPGRPADSSADERLQQVLTAYALLRNPEYRVAHGKSATWRMDVQRAAAEPQGRYRRPPRVPTPSTTPIRIPVLVIDTPSQRPPATGLWIGPARWHR